MESNDQAPIATICELRLPEQDTPVHAIGMWFLWSENFAIRRLYACNSTQSKQW